ncbi:metallophosphoesterase [Nonomuraea sp. NPDC052265]|uniref:metallophosphoesterase n=1 Tax=Nonomuraea sp. NPDC052265 TaxID=3364374 RepID=UPI0037C70D52
MNSLHRYIHATKPDRLVIIGDFMNYAGPSRWSKDTRAEYESDVFRESELGKRFLADLRRGYDGPVDFVEGNHDANPRRYLLRYAPALAESSAFNVETLLDFDSHGIKVVRGSLNVAPGWIAMHGHLDKIRTVTVPGGTAKKFVDRLHKSVVMGHTHRLGLMPHTVGTTSSNSVRWGMEVGNLMDMRRAEYLGLVTANWQSGFGMLYVEGKRVRPEVIPMDGNGSFIADGKVWG